MAHVLTAGDDANISTLLAAYLERDGFALASCADENEALRLARTNPPCLVILDIMLPSMDGWEVCREHASRPSITYVTQGSVREHRTGAGAPIVHNVGATTMDRGTATHFWENAGPNQAVLLVVEVLPRAAQ